MAFIDVVINFFRKTEKTIGSITLDALISEVHLRNTQSTEYPIESGANISDNIILQPKRLRLQGVVTNSPVRLFNPIINLAVSDAFSELERIFENKERISIVTNLKAYSNMIIESLNIPKDARIGESLEINATFKEIITVRTLTTAIPITDLGGDPDIEGLQAQPELNAGQQTESQLVEPESILQQLILDVRELSPNGANYLDEEGIPITG